MRNKPNLVDEMQQNEPNSRRRRVGRGLGHEGRACKTKPISGSGPAGAGARVQTKPIRRRPNTPTIPLFHHSSIPLRCQLCKTNPICRRRAGKTIVKAKGLVVLHISGGRTAVPDEESHISSHGRLLSPYFQSVQTRKLRPVVKKPRSSHRNSMYSSLQPKRCVEQRGQRPWRCHPLRGAIAQTNPISRIGGR